MLNWLTWHGLALLLALLGVTCLSSGIYYLVTVNLWGIISIFLGLYFFLLAYLNNKISIGFREELKKFEEARKNFEAIEAAFKESLSLQLQKQFEPKKSGDPDSFHHPTIQ
jgi:ABC-type transport system involved in multi-copper enzyme maturation permease subunit